MSIEPRIIFHFSFNDFVGKVVKFEGNEIKILNIDKRALFKQLVGQKELLKNKNNVYLHNGKPYTLNKHDLFIYSFYKCSTKKCFSSAKNMNEAVKEGGVFLKDVYFIDFSEAEKLGLNRINF